MNLTPGQVATFAKQAGFSGQTAAVAVAVAMGESGLNPSALGDTTITDAKWGPSIGLWQIRSLKAEAGRGTSRDGTRLSDPAFNARSAFAISSGGKNFRPWTIYATGAYLRHMKVAQDAVNLTSGGTSGEPTPNTNESTGDLSGFASLGSALTDPQTWMRFAWVITGATLILYSLARISGTAEAAGKIGKLAVDIVAFKGKGTIGKVARVVS